jgi:hypothetical protein
MKGTLLLRHLVGVRQGQHTFAGHNTQQFGAKVTHQALTLKTVLYAVLWGLWRV